MYLAWKELKHNKGRFALIIIMLFLVSYLIFFLTGLSYGLSKKFTSVLDSWPTNQIVLNKFANNNLSASTITQQQLDNYKLTNNHAPMGELFGVGQKCNKNKKKVNVAIFGINFNSFIKPKLINGNLPKNNNQIVISDELKKINNWKLNENIKINGKKQKYKIVGITTNLSYQTYPVIYTTLPTFNLLKFSNEQMNSFSAIVTKNKIKNNINDNLSTLSMKKFINNIPGYKAQISTFALMIGSLFIIVLFVIAIFMYIMTLQKKSMYGVMRAEGISSATIINSVISQAIILGIIGVGLGFILAIITSFILPVSMPYQNNVGLMILFAIILIIMATIGAIFSALQIINIDPADAMKGNE